jgi:hypothetical protein
MKMFDYSDLIRVIDNVEIREEREKYEGILKLKERYTELERSLVASGIFDDWNRLKQLCAKAKVRLCVSYQSEHSIGCVLGVGDFRYCGEYDDYGKITKRMSSGSSWHDEYGFTYVADKGIVWKTYHSSGYHSFQGFSEAEEKEKYETRIYLLETFRDTYENYRKFQLQKIEDKFANRIKTEDIIK